MKSSDLIEQLPGGWLRVTTVVATVTGPIPDQLFLRVAVTHDA